nr:IQ motif and SEC7 domain containing protein 1 [Hymenolepis microstoma]
MSVEVEKENDATKIDHSTRRRSIAGPMHKLFKRLSGIPSDNRISETTIKTRLSFQTWRRRKTIDRKTEEDDEIKMENICTVDGETFMRPLMASSTPATQPRELKRGPLKAAPLAEAEEVVFLEAKRPKLIASAAKRFSAISNKPKRVTNRFRRPRATEIKSPPKHHPRRRLSNAVDSSRSQSAQPMDTSNLRPLNGRHKKNLSLSGIGNDPSIMRSGITLTDVDKRQTPVVETNPFDEKTRTPFEIASTSLDSSLVSDAVRTTERIRLAGKTLFNKDPNLGIEYLIHQRILNRDPNEIAEFLAEKGLSRQAIGEYFGRLSDPLANLVTEAFIRRLNLRKVELDVALRRLLQQLHPDGESQKIEFLLTVLKNCYIEQNVEDVAKEFNDSETIGVLAYSIMLLHTTFYNQNARKHGKPMTKIEFINNNKGIDGGKDISTSLLEGIYDRVAEREFKTLPDPTYRLRKVDDLFSGSVKPENFVQRHRRFVAWFSGLEVFDFTARKPIIQRPSSQIRCLFIFNDLLVITKPVGSYRNNAVDEMLNGGTHRIRSFDRLAIRVGSPTLTSAEIIAEHPVVQTVHARSQDYRNYQHYSTDIPLNGPFLVRQIISLENIKILLFECESYRFGVQLCDEESVLTSISLPTAHARKKFIELLNESIWETGEVKRFSNSAPITPM